MVRIVVWSVALAACTLDPIVDDPPDRADRLDRAETTCHELTTTFVSRTWGAPAHPTVFVCGSAIEVTCGDGERALLVPSAQLACGPNISTFASRDRRTCRGPVELSAACTSSWGTVVYATGDANAR